MPETADTFDFSDYDYVVDAVDTVTAKIDLIMSAKEAGVPAGTALAYLIAPPLESMYALDSAMKAADVKLCKLYGPPSETNFGGGLLTGTQSACETACAAFAAAVRDVAAKPREG